jgi:hypothetical protein
MDLIAVLLGAMAILAEATELLGQLQSVVDRDKYERVIKNKFPGFVILKTEEFDESIRPDVRDGVSGALVMGNFDFDKNKDFAALLIGRIKNVAHSYSLHGREQVAHSYNVYDGMLVLCHGNEKSDFYSCETLGKADYNGVAYSTLSIIPPGRYKCEFNDEGEKDVLTTIDSIGEYSEKGGGFSVLQKDGAYFSCVDSD